MIGNPLLLGGGDYEISRSVRLRSSASAYFNRTPSSNGNRRTWTWSGWVKRGALSSEQTMFGSSDTTSAGYDACIFRFLSSNAIRFIQTGNTGGSIIQFDTTAVYRDASAWYHVILSVDTTQATNSNGVRLWVNGISQTGTFAAYTQNTDTSVNSTSFANYLGRWSSNSPQAYLDGYLTEINFIDGQALTPSSFGETDAVTGVWKPKKYAGTYGTNGFYLNFSDNSNNTAATIGKDYSGNGNNWTPNNISLTSGATYDSMIDTPTPVADGGNGRGNYATLNPLDVRSNSGTGTLTNGNLSAAATGTTNGSGPTRGSTQYITSDNYYFEVTVLATSGTSYSLIGVRQDGSGTYGADYCWLQLAGSTNSGIIVTAAGNVQTSLGFVAANDVIGVAVESAGWVTFYRNNTVVGTRQSFAASGGLQPFVEPRVGGAGANLASFAVNFGQRPFAYTPPSGFKALNTLNLPEPTIKKGNLYFDATLWTGNDTTRTITSNLSPDLLWIKARSAISAHALVDRVRGNRLELRSDSTAAEANETNGPDLGTDSFTLNNTRWNASGTTYVGWQWKEGATQGFDIVTYTGNGANANISHGLGVAPSMIIRKARNASAQNNWYVYHRSLSANGAVFLNLTDAYFASSSYWNNTAPTSTVFTVGAATNVLNDTWVAYLFAEVAGFSRFGSYTGNGSSDGPFVFCGFRPRFVLVKDSSAGTGQWVIWDTARDSMNVVNNALFPNSSSAESTGGADLDILSNGFKLRRSATNFNASGVTYIFAAFAENPTKYSLAR